MTLPVVTVTAGPADTNVAVLATVKSELGITGSSQDTKLARLISAVGAAFSAELQREPWRQTYSEQLPGAGGQYLHLTGWPIESVTSVSTDGGTVTASEYSVAAPRRDKLYRDNGWQRTRVTLNGYSGAGDQDLTYTAAYVGGYVMPGSIGDWAASTAYTVGQFVRPVADTSIVVLFECTTAGTTDATEPTWDETAGNTTTDNTATWTARAATEMPFDMQEAALIQVADWFRGGLNVPAGVKSERHGPHAIEYMAGGSFDLMSAVKTILRRYR